MSQASGKLTKKSCDCGAMCIDSASNHVLCIFEVSKEVYETAKGKYKFEALAKTHDISIKACKVGNYIHNLNLFSQSCTL